MFKIKLLAGFAGLVTTLLVMTAPAMAEIQSNNGQTQGPIKTYPETTTFESVEGGPAITCKSTNSKGEVVAKGGWIIQVKTQTQQGKYFYQAPTLKGPHEQFKFENWGVCTGPVSFPATIECSIQWESVTLTIATGSVQAPGCVVKVGTGENTCTVNVAQGGNQELSEVKVANAGTNGIEVGSNVSGISSTAQESKALCKELGIKGGQKTGKFFTKNNLVTEGQKLV